MKNKLVGAIAGLAAMASLGVGGAAIVTAPAAATLTHSPAAVSHCSDGYVNGDKAWGTCRSGSGSWSLTVQCYYWGANTAYGNGPGSIYASCPDWSHITSIILRTQQ